VPGGVHVRLEVRNRCSGFNGYRAARVKSLFNAESGANFSLDADLPIEDLDWKLGVIVGPSGSGKTSLGRQVFGEDAMHDPPRPSVATDDARLTLLRSHGRTRARVSDLGTPGR